MAQFISLSSLSAFFTSPADLMNPEGLAAFMNKLSQAQQDALCMEKGWNPQDFQRLLDNLRTAQKVLFYSWIMQSQSLEDLLTRGKLGTFDDRGGHLQHQFAPEYRSFIAPFLAPVLLRFAGGDIEQTKKAFTYTVLLDHDHVALVETQLFAGIRDKVQRAIKEMNTHRDETELLAVLQSLCSEDILHCVNRLSRPMYATRLEYVDAILSFIRAKACSVRLANWVLKRLEQISLNKEHQYKIEDLRKDLATGQLQVRNTLEKRRSLVFSGRAVLFTFLLLVMAFVVYVIRYKPFSDVSYDQPSDATAFEQFSVDERRRIDSILQEMNGARDENDILDAGAIFPQGAALSLRKAFLNESLERICEDFSLDAQLQEQGFGDTCKNSIPFTTLEGTAKLAAYKGSMEALFRNESAYDVIVLIGNNRTGGSVYSAFVPKGELLKARIDVGDILLIIAGHTFQKYDRPGGVPPTEMPSTSFKHHFCNTDFNYAETIYTAYEVSRRGAGKCKFLVAGSRGDYVDFVDVSGVLEPW